MAAEAGIFKHPMVYRGIADPRIHKMPGDTRLLRDIKVGEVPGWLAKRDFSPLGLLYGYKRLQMRHHTIHMTNPWYLSNRLNDHLRPNVIRTWLLLRLEIWIR